MGIVVVYDITDPKSFASTKDWMEEARKNCEDANIQMVLVGNKCDAQNRVVSLSDLKAYAAELNIKFYESSAKENININEVRIDTKEIY